MKADKKYYNKFGSSKSLVHKPENNNEKTVVKKIGGRL